MRLLAPFLIGDFLGMPIGDRDYVRGEHPPNCTCVDCVNRRLGIWKERSSSKPSRHKTKSDRYKPTRRFPSMRSVYSLWSKLKKLLVIASLLVTTTVVVVTVCKFISGELHFTSFIIFTAIGLLIVIWCLKSLSKYRLSFTRMFLVLLIASLFAFVSVVYLDVRSIDDVKESVSRALATETSEFRGSVDLLIQRAELKVVEVSETAEETVEEEVKEIANTKNVYIDGAVLVGADGHRITLKNNPEAVTPSWEQLKSFLLKDKTDEIPYNFSSFVCADFAETLHNNAEVTGIKAAFVSIELGPCLSFPRIGGHALNAFETTDKGLVYIDCTGSTNDLSINGDTIVDAKVGRDYIPLSIFPEPGWSVEWENLGKVLKIEVIQW